MSEAGQQKKFEFPNLSLRDLAIPLGAGCGLTFLLLDIFLSVELATRLFGPTLGLRLASMGAPACVAIAFGSLLVFWATGSKWRHRNGSEDPVTESAYRLWPLMLLNLLMIAGSDPFLHYLHLYAGLGTLSLTAWCQRLGLAGEAPPNEEDGPDRSFLRRLPALMYIAMGTYAAVFITMALLQYYSLNMNPVDGLSAEQRMWNALHGTFFKSDNTPRSFLAEHIMVFDVLLLPIYWLWPGMPILLIIHVLTAATSAIPVWIYASEHLKSQRLANAFAVAFLLHPGLHYANLEVSGAAYNPGIYAMPFLLWGLVFLRRDDLWKWVICSVFAISVKEEIALIVFMQAVYITLCLGRTNKKALIIGAGSAVFSLLWFGLCLWIFIPYFAGSESHALAHYSDLGTSSKDIIEKLIRSPWLVPQRMLTAQNMELLAQLFLPYGWLGLFDLMTLLMAFPAYGYLMLTNASYIPPHSIQYYYQIPLMPFAAIGSIRGLSIVSRFFLKAGLQVGQKANWQTSNFVTDIQLHAATFLLIMATGSMIILSKTPASVLFYDPLMTMFYYGHVYAVPERTEVVEEIKEMIPRDKVVAATEYLALHFSHWKHCYVNVREHSEPIDYMVFDIHDKWRRLYSADSPPPHLAYINSGAYELVFQKQGFVLLRRKLHAD
ncbi:MAG: DUF2079 domain-containing protein [Planctomycetota bacterium]|nr:DUF2079 domain-containing protein [Planctomycetota bacterium]